ncbi:hypothetical protein [Escherichia coli]|uniref:hypothetical protein n=3 Tax=Enterobacteriaceae TaxID=543 RepID=UPI002180BA3D|nr:hypothetical protein [Escherichia coli]
MSLTLPIMYFKTGSDLSQITHFEVNYPDDFVKQAWERPEINLFIVCVATKKGAVREIKGGMAVLTSIPASNGLELSRALDDVLRKSDELRPLAGQKNNVFLPAKVGLAGDPPTEQELLSLFYQQCLKHGRHCCKVSDEAAFCLIQRPYISKTLLTRRISPRGSP